MVRKYVLSIIVATGLALLYVHQQNALYKISYILKNNEKKFEQLKDQNEFLNYTVARLKSPQALEETMVAKHIELAHPDECRVLALNKLNDTTRQEYKENIFVKNVYTFFALKRVAVAEVLDSTFHARQGKE